MKKNIILLSLIWSVLSFGQSIGLGLGVSRSPYKTKHSVSVSPLPIIELQYGYFIVGTEGAGVLFPIDENISFGATFVYNNAGIKAKDLETPYQGIDDRKAEVEAGGFVNFEFNSFTLTGRAYKDISNKSDGTNFGVKVGYEHPVTQQLIINPSIDFAFYDKKFMKYYYGISQSEAIRTGLTAVEPDNGNITTIGLDFIYMHSESFIYGVFNSYSMMSKEFKTDIVDNRKNFTTGVFLVYNWQ